MPIASLLKGSFVVILVFTSTSCGPSEQSLYADRGAAPAASPGGYLGRWARVPQDCEARAFTFSADRILAPPGLSCDVGRVEASPAGYSLTTLCRIDGKESVPGRLLVTLPAVAGGRSLTVEGGPLDQPLGLVRCSEPAEVALAAGAG